MFALIIGALTRRAAGPIAAAVALAMAASTGCQAVRLKAARSDLARAEAQVASLREQYGACKSGRRTLETAITEQNAEVEAFARIQSARVAQAEKVATAAAKGRIDAELRAAKLLNSQPQGVDACARFMSADRAVLESLR